MKFDDMSKFEEHVERIHVNKRCSKCEERFEEEEELREHEEKDHGWKCDRCSSQYICEQGWKENLEKRHRIEYNCRQCRKVLNMRKN